MPNPVITTSDTTPYRLQPRGSQVSQVNRAMLTF